MAHDHRERHTSHDDDAFGGRGQQGNIYSDLLGQQSDTIRAIREHVERVLAELEEKRDLCTAKRLLLNTFKKDIQDSFGECRSTVKKSIAAITGYLKQQETEMTQELEQTMTYNQEILQQNAQHMDKTLHQIEAQIEEGRALQREQDMFTFFAKGSLYRQLPQPSVPRLRIDFKDTFPDLTQLSILPWQIPLQHAVAVDIRQFLQSGVQTRIVGNIFHAGFRFQIQLKHDERYLSAYLCLRAWHDVSPFLRVTVNFTLTLQDGPELLHTATAKNTFQGPNDGWGWNKFVTLQKLQDCTDVIFLISFNDMAFSFIAEDEHNERHGHGHGHSMDTSGDHGHSHGGGGVHTGYSYNDN